MRLRRSGKNFCLWGQEFYSRPRHWVRILYFAINGYNCLWTLFPQCAMWRCAANMSYSLITTISRIFFTNLSCNIVSFYIFLLKTLLTYDECRPITNKGKVPSLNVFAIMNPSLLLSIFNYLGKYSVWSTVYFV